jgi:hypothetical protein
VGYLPLPPQQRREGVGYLPLPPPLPGLVVAVGTGAGLGETVVVEHVAVNFQVIVDGGLPPVSNDQER